MNCLGTQMEKASSFELFGYANGKKSVVAACGMFRVAPNIAHSMLRRNFGGCKHGDYFVNGEKPPQKYYDQSNSLVTVFTCFICVIQICPGITLGIVLNGELYAQGSDE